MSYTKHNHKCSKCNKPFRNECKHTHCHCICNICYSSHIDCKCKEQKRCCECFKHTNQCDRFICNDEFRYRLGGLQGGLAFRLRQLIGCEVKMQVECDGCIEMKGTVKFVGKDWVELEVDKVNGYEDNSDEENTEVQNSSYYRRNSNRRRREILKENRKSSGYQPTPTRIIPFESIKWTDIHHHHLDC